MILRRIGVLILLTFFLSTTGLSCTLLESSEDGALFKPVTLDYWRVFDTGDTLEEVIAAYQKIHTHVTINYRTFRYEEYEQQLLDAFAEDRGPDLFSLPNSWMERYNTKILPFPRAMKVGYKQNAKEKDDPPIRGTRILEGYTKKQMQAFFVDTVVQDVVRQTEKGDSVLGLPYSVDVLALFYNRDLLNN